MIIRCAGSHRELTGDWALRSWLPAHDPATRSRPATEVHRQQKYTGNIDLQLLTRKPMHPRARQLIEDLALQPHPEGGYFREVYRSSLTVQRAEGADRAALTTIYFLLPEGAVSRWHRVAADEVWHHYEGDALELQVVADAHDGEPAQVHTRQLGKFAPGLAPVQVVPAGAWQSARSLGRYTLVGCTVAPGFEFADFVLIDDVPPHELPAPLRQA